MVSLGGGLLEGFGIGWRVFRVSSMIVPQAGFFGICFLVKSDRDGSQ